MRYPTVVVHESCLAVFLVDVYSNVDGHLIVHLLLLAVGLNAAIPYSRAWRIQGAAPEVCPFTHPTDAGQRALGLTNRRELTQTRPRDFSSIHTRNHPVSCECSTRLSELDDRACDC